MGLRRLWHATCDLSQGRLLLVAGIVKPLAADDLWLRFHSKWNQCDYYASRHECDSGNPQHWDYEWLLVQWLVPNQRRKSLKFVTFHLITSNFLSFRVSATIEDYKYARWRFILRIDEFKSWIKNMNRNFRNWSTFQPSTGWRIRVQSLCRFCIWMKERVWLKPGRKLKRFLSVSSRESSLCWFRMNSIFKYPVRLCVRVCVCGAV